MSTLVALTMIWSIVALALFCCYRLWRWSPENSSKTVPVREPVETPVNHRAA